MRPAESPPPFLERREELARLDALLANACEGRSHCAFIGAEAGAGKSRLVEEFRRAHANKALFLFGRAFQATSRMSYAVWVDALDMHLRSLHRRELLHVLRDSPDLRSLFPAASQRLDPPEHGGEGADAGPAPDQTRLYGQVAALLRTLAAAAPVVVVLENLQWADPSSLELLHAVLHATQDSRLLFLAPLRSDEVDEGGLLARLSNSLEASGLASGLALPSLSVAATGAIASHASGSRWPDDAVLQLHLVTQGNPFFASELAKQARAEPGGGRPVFREMGARSLPESIESLIHERLRELPDDARRVLALAAVFEAPIGYPLLRAATAFDEERLLDALDLLTAHRLLDERVEGAEIVYEFHRPLVQATVYRRMGLARQRFLHGVIADELMKQPATSDAATVARHLVAAEPGARQKAALPYLLQAARDALKVFGNHEVIYLLESAMRAAKACGVHDLPLAPLYLQLGESQKRLGLFDDAIATWTTALPAANEVEQASLHRCIARAMWQQGREQAAAMQLEEGLRALGSADATAEGALLRQERALARVRQGDVRGGLEECARVLAIAGEDGDRELLGRTWTVMSMAHGLRGDMRSAQQAGVRALHYCGDLPYPGAAFLTHYTLASLNRYEGDAQAFESHREACARIAQRMHAVALESWPMSLQVERLALEGRLEEAVAIGEKAIALDEGIGQGTMLPRTHSFTAVAWRLLGQNAKAARHQAQAEELHGRHHKTELRSVVVVEGARAFLAFLEGDLEGALRISRALAERIRAFEPLPFFALHPHVLPLAAECAARLGRRDEVGAVVDEIRALRKGAVSAEACLAHVRGLLALQSGDAAVACDEFARAVTLRTELRRRHEAARTRIDLADALEQLGDVQAAGVALNLAGGEFEAIGATRDAAMVGQRLRRMNVRPTFTSVRRTAGQPVSARESEVMALVARGCTNKEIASELFLSELTVETHVKNILRKLALKSRSQIASYLTGAANLVELPAGRRRGGAR
ncbi:helix-turn-helix transcriptional regulator [Ramlibacter sp.]|uniref:helix-turn-helix transcriptional regulator n=1 Tax=Ramlibacter sp. TaxID=1917967 RepID=UPI003D0A0250